MKRIFVPLLLALLSCGESGPPEPAFGVVIVAHVSSPPDARRDAARVTASAIEKNLAVLGFSHARATLSAVDKMAIRVPGGTEAQIREIARAILKEGWMRLYEAADATTQAAYNRNGTCPPGYRVEINVEARRRPEAPWDGDNLVVRAEPIVRTGMISDAWPEGSDVLFRLDKEPRQTFEAAARRGPLVLTIVEKAAFVGRMRFDAPGADGLIPLATNDEAKWCALELMARKLPVKVEQGNRGWSIEYYGVPPTPQK